MSRPASRPCSTSPRWRPARCRRAWPRSPISRARPRRRTAPRASGNGRTRRIRARCRRTARLLGAHKVQANYAPPIDFTLAQDFMPALGLMEAGATPAGASRLRWTPPASATGYALMLSGANQSGDIVMWTSSKGAAMMPHLDYLSPAEVKRQIAAGSVLPPAYQRMPAARRSRQQRSGRDGDGDRLRPRSAFRRKAHRRRNGPPRSATRPPPRSCAEWAE